MHSKTIIASALFLMAGFATTVLWRSVGSA